MPRLIQPLELTATPSLARRLLRLLLIIACTTVLAVFGFAVFVVVVTR